MSNLDYGAGFALGGALSGGGSSGFTIHFNPYTFASPDLSQPLSSSRYTGSSAARRHKTTLSPTLKHPRREKQTLPPGVEHQPF